MNSQQSISGNATTDKNENLPGVEVIAEGKTLPSSVPAITNANGHYDLGDLPVGEYQITASMNGFKTQRRVLTLTMNISQKVDFVMTELSRD